MAESECGCTNALEYTWQQLEGLTILFIFDRLEGVPEALPLVAGHLCSHLCLPAPYAASRSSGLVLQ